MALNQPQGPPASHRQLQRLLELLTEAGYSGFRDARGPLGLSQRQGNGKFTRDEADELIAQLEGDDHDPSAPTGMARSGGSRGQTARPQAARPPRSRSAAAAGSDGGHPLGDVSDEELAAELQRRGWIVMEP